MSPTPEPVERRDRRARLREDGTRNGIDFIEVLDDAQTVLRVHFLEPAPGLAALRAAITEATITGGATIPTVVVHPPSTWIWTTPTSGRPAVQMSVDEPGDFSTYTFALVASSPVLDRAYDHVAFTFKAGCPSTIDCEPRPPSMDEVLDAGPPIDYLAKDFDSFQRALSDFSAARYPAWQERSEADFGVMFLEALSSLADDLSYQQDRVASEAWLETATERRSLVRLARLVDYEPRVATVATTLLQFQVNVGGSIPAGVVVGALAPDGALVEFETGTGLADAAIYVVDPSWNELPAHWFDDEQRCVPTGATELYIVRPSAPLPRERPLLVEEAPAVPGDPPRRAIVELTEDPADDVDPLFGPPGGTLLTRLRWRDADALSFALDLARTNVRGNLVPATHGRRRVDRFVTTGAWPGPAGIGRAVVRTGPNGSTQFLHTLAGSPLAWLAPASPDEDPQPELALVDDAGQGWNYRRSLLGSTSFDEHVTLDPVRYRTIDGTVGASDYDGDDGWTVRFGDGQGGAVPADGTRFVATYRVGGGTIGNLAADALTRIDPTTTSTLGVAGVTNPLAVDDGRDEESAAEIRELAPHAFRAKQYRAVRAEDYDRAVVRELPWVQRSGTTFRHTGSWLTVFTTVDPRGAEELPPDRGLALARLLDRYRLAGYEAFGLAPRYASIDVVVGVCARPAAFRGDVEEGVLDALRAFFHPDRFTFGVPLERSALEAAVQDVPGVDGVTSVSYRRRGHTPGFVPMLDSVVVARDEIVRADNDPNRPDAGSYRGEVEGGK